MSEDIDRDKNRTKSPRQDLTNSRDFEEVFSSNYDAVSIPERSRFDNVTGTDERRKPLPTPA